MSRLFESWCELNRTRSLPASVSDVAKFVSDCSHLSPDVIQSELVAIDNEHNSYLYAPPGKAQAVQDAFDRAYGPVDPPRSWLKAEWQLFATLPWGVKQVIVRREADRERTLRNLQNEAADLRNKFKRMEKDEVKTPA